MDFGIVSRKVCKDKKVKTHLSESKGVNLLSKLNNRIWHQETSIKIFLSTKIFLVEEAA